MCRAAIFFIIEGLSSEALMLPKPVPNVVKSAIFQAKIQTNGKKQIRIKSHTTNLHIFVCNGGHSVSSKNFDNLLFSKYKIRIKKQNPVLIFGDTVIEDFLNIPVQSNVIYWVSWKTKSHNTLRNRSDVFCLLDGELTNKLLTFKIKYNKKKK